jgi:phosphoadenosine phosphosulfate reductase
MRVLRRDLESINARLERARPEEVLAWVHGAFGPRAALLSSMQKAGTALCHIAEQAKLPLDVVFVDTGVLHRETLATRDELARTHEHLRVVTLTPEQSFAEQTRTRGLLYLSREGQLECCDLRKSAPLRAVRGRYDVLVSALRRKEGGARSRIRVVDLDEEMSALRVHPLADWSNEDIEQYFSAHPKAVLNPLHGMGFPTIGCFTCTTPVRPDEPERAGRWRHLAGVAYCGINPTDRSSGAEPFVELDDRYRAALELRPS